MKQTTILVSGAAGQSGSLIVQALAAQQQPVRALVRNTAKKEKPAGLPGVEIVVGDMLVKDSLTYALDGIERAILISSADDHMVETQCNFIDALKEQATERVRNPEPVVDNSTYELFGVIPTRFEQFAMEHAKVFSGHA